MTEQEIREKIAKRVCSLVDVPMECERCHKGRGCPDEWEDVAETVGQILAIPALRVENPEMNCPECHRKHTTKEDARYCFLKEVNRRALLALADAKLPLDETIKWEEFKEYYSKLPQSSA